MSDKKFLQSGTKTSVVVISVIIAISLLVLVITGLITGSFLNVSVVGSSVIVFIVSIFLGSVQIKVFGDYKRQSKLLCADGIFYICLTILVAISALVFVAIPDAQFDLRYIIFFFVLVFALWRILIAIIGFKNKYYTAPFELILAVFWIVSGVGVLLSVDIATENVGAYLMCSSNYLLGAFSVIYMLYAYIFREPKFLETQEGFKTLEKENIERQQRLNRFNGSYNNFSEINDKDDKDNADNLEDKLNKLKNLKEKGFISEEEYDKKKKELLDSEFN